MRRRWRWRTASHVRHGGRMRGDVGQAGPRRGRRAWGLFEFAYEQHGGHGQAEAEEGDDAAEECDEETAAPLGVVRWRVWRGLGHLGRCDQGIRVVVVET